MKNIIATLLLTSVLLIGFSLKGNSQTNTVNRDSVIHQMVKYINLGFTDSSSIISEYYINHPDFVYDSEFWFYRGMAYKALYKKHKKHEIQI